jgi:hypothetical protein
MTDHCKCDDDHKKKDHDKVVYWYAFAKDMKKDHDHKKKHHDDHKDKHKCDYDW